MKDQIVAFAAANGYLLSRSNAARKSQALCQMLRVMAARAEVHTGYYWTMEEERTIARYLMEHEGLPVDLRELQLLVPTRTPAAIAHRMKDSHNAGIVNIIQQLLDEPLPELDDDEDDASEWGEVDDDEEDDAAQEEGEDEA